MAPTATQTWLEKIDYVHAIYPQNCTDDTEVLPGVGEVVRTKSVLGQPTRFTTLDNEYGMEIDAMHNTDCVCVVCVCALILVPTAPFAQVARRATCSWSSLGGARQAGMAAVIGPMAVWTCLCSCSGRGRHNGRGTSPFGATSTV